MKHKEKRCPENELKLSSSCLLQDTHRITRSQFGKKSCWCKSKDTIYVNVNRCIAIREMDIS